MTKPLPCHETERSSLMPSTVLITSSSGWVTSDSTSSGAAPGKPTRTETVGTSTEGKRSTPSLKKPAVPTTTSDSTIMDAKTGRRMHISASFCTVFNRTYKSDRPYRTYYINRQLRQLDPTVGCPDRLLLYR